MANYRIVKYKTDPGYYVQVKRWFYPVWFTVNYYFQKESALHYVVCRKPDFAEIEEIIR